MSDDDYRMNHRPADPDPESAAPFHHLNHNDNVIFPDDVYTHPHYYTGYPKDRETQRQMQQARGNPEHPVTIYRALPKGHTKINTGDWVTPSAQYAKGHAAQEDPDHDWLVIKAIVPAKHLWTQGDELSEFGYHGPTIEADIHHPGGKHAVRMQAASNLPKGAEFHFTPADPARRTDHHELALHAGGTEVGKLNWGHDGDISGVDTHHSHRHQGIATALYTKAHELSQERGIQPPGGSVFQTPDGSGFRAHFDALTERPDVSHIETHTHRGKGENDTSLHDHLLKHHYPGSDEMVRGYDDETAQRVHDKITKYDPCGWQKQASTEDAPLRFHYDEQETGGSKYPTEATLTAVHADHGEVGSLKYFPPKRRNGQILIKKLEVAPEHRRNGYGSALMDELQTRMPDASVNHGDRTDDGEAWWGSYGKGKSDKRGRTAVRQLPKPTAAAMGDWDEDDAPATWYHGTNSNFSGFRFEQHGEGRKGSHWNNALGVHFASDHGVAKHHFGPRVIHAEVDLKNPKHYGSEFDMDREAHEHAQRSGIKTGVTPEDASDPHSLWGHMSHSSARDDIAHTFKKHLMDQGHDGVVYGNEMEGDGKPSAIAFHPHQIKITKDEGEVDPYSRSTSWTQHYHGSLPADGPMTMDYIRNPETSTSHGDFGEQYGQHVEPAGRYLSQGSHAPEGWESGSVTFQKPLHLHWGDEGYRDPSNWKHQLSARYDGKTGEALSRAVAADGHDGIVTHDKYGTSEIVDLRHLHRQLPKPTAKAIVGVSVSWDHDHDAPETWSDDYRSWIREKPHAAAVSHAQEQASRQAPTMHMDLGSTDNATGAMRHMMSQGGHPKADDSFVMKHSNPNWGKSQAFHSEGEPGVALHPDRWDYGTLAHEVAHHLHEHELGHHPTSDEEAHGPDFVRHYQHALNGFGRGASEILGEHYHKTLDQIQALHRQLPKPTAHAVQAAAVPETAGRSNQSVWQPIRDEHQSVHRGFGVELSDEDHQVVHDQSRPLHERAARLMDHLSRNNPDGEGGLGVHWTTDANVANHFAKSDAKYRTKHDEHADGERYGHNADGFPRQRPETRVVLHAHFPEDEHIAHEEEDQDGALGWDERNAAQFDQPHGHGVAFEREVPIKRGQPVRVHSISWGLTSHRADDQVEHDHQTTRYDLPETMTHQAIRKLPKPTARAVQAAQKFPDQERPYSSARSVDMANYFPRGGVESIPDVPWVSHPRAREAWSGDDAAWGRHPVLQVPVNGLHHTQHTTLRQPWREGDHPPVRVVRHEGQDWLLDGHHRVVNAIDDDQTHVPAHVLDLDRANIEHTGARHQASGATTNGRMSTWDEIGERHPHVYGEDGDGEGIGYAVNHLAHSRPDDSDAENHMVHDLDFQHEQVNPKHIDYARIGPDDNRVQHARQGYRIAPKVVPPLVLVHRHGVYHVADGHHRAQAAALEHQPSVRAYVAYSPYPDEPFEGGSVGMAKGPFHGAEPHPGLRPGTTHTAASAEPETFYHGTTRENLTHVLPPHEHGAGVMFPHDTSRDHAYASNNASDAWDYAEKAWGATEKGVPRVYEVRPRGEHEQDPPFDQHGNSRSNFSGDRRSRHGWNVVRELPMPEHMGTPEEWDPTVKQGRLLPAATAVSEEDRQKLHMDVQRTVDKATDAYREKHMDDNVLAHNDEPMKASDIPPEHQGGFRFSQNNEAAPHDDMHEFFHDLAGTPAGERGRPEHEKDPHRAPVPTTTYHYPGVFERLHLDEHGNSWRRNFRAPDRPDGYPRFDHWSGPHSASETLATHPTFSQKGVGEDGKRVINWHPHNERVRRMGHEPTESYADVSRKNNETLTRGGWGVVGGAALTWAPLED